jgi:aminoglycoside phosphotransferase (APT) family kinase protein
VGEIEFEEALVRALLREQHPDLAGLELRRVAGGWDNQMWRLGPDLAVRMPRTERAPSLLRAEQRWLPQLAGKLPLPVPVPVRIGEPSPRFGKTWTVTRWVAGEPADYTPVTRPASARVLAGFLSALHSPAPADAPVNPIRSIPLAVPRPGVDAWLPLIASLPRAGDARRLWEQAVSVWEQAVSAPAWQDAPVWLHGDLHPANAVVRDGALAGIVDFGELCAGDPATDLSAAWLLLPAGTASRFFHAYPDVDSATVQRARGWAVARAMGLISIGRNGRLGLPGGKPSWEPAGHAALEHILAAA